MPAEFIKCPQCGGYGWVWKSIGKSNWKQWVGCHVCDIRGWVEQFSPVVPEGAWSPYPVACQGT